MIDFYPIGNSRTPQDKIIKDITTSALKELFLVLNNKKEGSLATQQLADLITASIQKKVEECLDNLLQQKLEVKVKKTKGRKPILE